MSSGPASRLARPGSIPRAADAALRLCASCKTAAKSNTTSCEERTAPEILLAVSKGISVPTITDSGEAYACTRMNNSHSAPRPQRSERDPRTEAVARRSASPSRLLRRDSWSGQRPGSPARPLAARGLFYPADGALL